MSGIPAVIIFVISPPYFAFLKGGDNVQTVAAGLPEISGHFYTTSHYNTPQPLTDGAFKHTLSDTGISASGNGQHPWRIAFSAASSNKIYGKSETVQQAAIQYISQSKF